MGLIMLEEEQPFLQITADDIAEANQLSLACPYCGSPVEREPVSADFEPVVCEGCSTLYHHACWQSISKCAILGCGSTKAHPHGQRPENITIISLGEIPTESQVRQRNKELKQRERELARRASPPSTPVAPPAPLPTFWQRLWRFLVGGA